MKRQFLERGYGVAKALLLEGKAEMAGAISLRVDASGSCESPVGFEHKYASQTHDAMHRPTPGQLRTFYVDGEGRCRKCGSCLKHRTQLWTQRAIQETRMSSRTWFGTLTLNPNEHQLILNEARSYCHNSAVDFDAQDFGTQFQDRVRHVGQRLTKYLKRVRAQTSAPFRYIFVVEMHKSMLPHLHCLVHEQQASSPIRKAILQDQWTHGFSNWKLVAAGHRGACYYTCKYLSKQSVARVRASVGYGNTPTGAAPEEREHTTSGSGSARSVATAPDGGETTIHGTVLQVPHG